MIRPLKRWMFLAAGAIAGALSATVFLGLHAILLVPIWFSLVRAVSTGVVAGAVVANAFAVLNSRNGVQLSLARGAIFGVFLWLILLPPSIVELSLKLVFPTIVEPVEVALVLAALILPAAAATWLSRRTAGAIASVILAVVALFIVTGGPIGPDQFRRGTPLFVGLLPVFAVAGACLTLVLRAFVCTPGRFSARAV